MATQRLHLDAQRAKLRQCRPAEETAAQRVARIHVNGVPHEDLRVKPVGHAQGGILMDGRQVTEPGPDRMVVFQNYSLLPWKTVRQNVEFGLKFKKIPAAERRATVEDILHKVGPLVGVLVEEVPLAGWSVGAAPVACAAQVDAIISAGANTAEEKGRFIAEASRLLKDVLGPQLADVSYVVIHEVPKDSWGYDGLTQAHWAQNR